MKKLSILLLSLGTSFTLFSQNTNVIENTGDVGIGTLSPAGNLELRGTDTQRMIFSTPNSNQENSARIEFWEYLTGISNPDNAHFAIQYNGALNSLLFKGSAIGGTKNETFMSISRTGGKVGIGTTNPIGKFQVQGAAGEQAAGQVHIVGNGEGGPGDAYISFDEGAEANSKWSIGVKDNGNVFAISQGLTMDAAPKFVIKEDDGDVGIGTTSPTSLLHIKGGSSDLTIDETPGVSGNSADIYLRNLDASDAVTNQLNIFAEGSGSYIFAQKSSDPLLSLGVGFDKALNIRAGKKVGIGTTTPSERLEVDGNIKTSGKIIIGTTQPTGEFAGFKLAVDGQIVAKEVTVQDADWADFVFADDYQLKTLDEVKTFINDNSHLPDVPSEQEILKNGLSLAEMQKIQMQKIEELTLYVIQLKEELELVKTSSNKN